MFLFYLENLLPDLLIGKRKKDIQETGERGRKKEGTSSGDPQQEVKAQGSPVWRRKSLSSIPHPRNRRISEDRKLG